MHLSRQHTWWSLRCSWSIAYRQCSNYIFILDLTPGFSGLGKDNYKTRRKAFKFWDSMRLILETWRFVWHHWGQVMPYVIQFSQWMVCCLFSIQPLPKPMLIYCQLHHLEQTLVKLESRYNLLSSGKWCWECCLQNFHHVVYTLDMLKNQITSCTITFLNLRRCVCIIWWYDWFDIKNGMDLKDIGFSIYSKSHEICTQFVNLLWFILLWLWCRFPVDFHDVFIHVLQVTSLASVSHGMILVDVK